MKTFSRVLSSPVLATPVTIAEMMFRPVQGRPDQSPGMDLILFGSEQVGNGSEFASGISHDTPDEKRDTQKCQGTRTDQREGTHTDNPDQHKGPESKKDA